MALHAPLLRSATLLVLLLAMLSLAAAQVRSRLLADTGIQKLSLFATRVLFGASP